MPHTGEKCQTSGIYDGICTKNGHRLKQIALSEGDTFPPCNVPGSGSAPPCQGSVSWTLAQATK